MAATSNGTKTSFVNTPQAQDDAITGIDLTEDSTGIFLFNVMANDAGGKAKSLYSIDAGGQPDLLLAKDAARTEADTNDFSTLGARIWITNEGQVAYELTETVRAQLQQLAAGETLTDSFTYAIQLGNGALSWATASFALTGTNDAPVIVLEDLAGAVVEAVTPAGTLTDSGIIGFTDADQGEIHIASSAPVGTTLGTLVTMQNDAAARELLWTYTVDAAALESMAEGETRVESFTITLDDQNGGVVTRQVDVTLTGTNDVATITGEASGVVTEDQNVTDGMLAASGALDVADADANQSLFVAQANVAGSGGYGTFTLDESGAWTYQADNSNAAIQELKAGESLVDTFTAVSLDGSSSQVVSVTINGADDEVTALNGFESGDFSGWDLLGAGAVEAQHGAYQPTEGDYLAALYGSGASAGQITSFLGLDAGALNAMGNGNATTGSALKTTVNVEAGDVVHFDWAFIATDYLPYNDFSVAVIGNGQVLELADIQAVGNFGTTGWQSFDYTAPTDMVLVVGVAVTNVLDSAGSPQLLIDNLTVL